MSLMSPAAARHRHHHHHVAVAAMAVVMVAAAVAASSAALAAPSAVPAYADHGDHPLALASTVKIDKDAVIAAPGPDSSFGISAVNLGDLDGDGAIEFAVGAPGSVGQANTGRLYILFTDPADGSVKRAAVIDGNTPNGPPSLLDGSRFGHAMAGMGDLDGDGTVDLAVGASGGPFGRTSTGDLFVVFLNPDGSVKRTAEINGQTPNGPSLAEGDRFGAGVANMGDLDGDGTVELAVSSPGNFFQATGTARLHVLSLNPDGSVARTVAIDSLTPNGPPSTASAEFFGVSVANIGDLDGDGVLDLAVGAAARPTAGVATGSLYVLFMNPDASVKRTAEVNGQTPNAPALAANDRFGWSAAGAGDLDGDGTPEIAVGALGHGIAGVGTGELYVMFMNPDGSVKRTAAVDGTTPNGPPLDDGDRFGASISNMGDLDGDGRADLAVGTFGDDIMHLIYLNADGTVRLAAQTDSSTVSAVAAAAESSRLGASAAGIGDLDGDGVTDLAVGAPGRILGHVSTGDAYIVFMNPNGTVKRTVEVNSQTPNGPASLARDDRFGTSVAGIGDLDGDGITEIAVGATGHIVNGTGTGDVYVMFMNPNGTVKRTVEVNSQTPNGPASLADGDRFGTSVAGLGDLDDDGVPDMAAGAEGHYGLGHANVGDVYVMFMNADGTVKRTVEVNSQTPNGPSLGEDARFGSSVAGIGDLDGDGVPDMAAGATGHLFEGAATGSLYVMFMNADGTVKSTVEINSQTPNGPASLADSDRFGTSVAGLGDLDGDNIAEIAAGATGVAIGDAGTTGDLYVMFMNADGTVKRTAEVNSKTPNGPHSLADGARFGSSVAGLGDLDGDGGAEIAVGAPGTDSLYVAFASADQSETRTVEIGALGPLTKNDGPHRAGEHRAFAVNTAISDFNEYLAGSGATWRLSVDIRDSQGLPSTTLRQAMDMHGGDGINFIVGPSFSSGVGAVITDYINPGNVTDLALVSPSSTSPKWALVDNVYRLAIADDKGGSVIAGLLAQEGKKAIIPVWVNDPFGTGLADATVKRFLELGGVADYSTDPASGQTVRSYDRCSDTYTTCIEDQFPGMVDELAGAVTKYAEEYGSDRVAVVFVGFELPDFIAEAVRGHPVLRTVQWVGSDADVLDPLLVVEGSAVRQFMTDVDFRTYVFAGSVDSARYLALTDRLERQFPGDTFSTYTYSSYDTVWAVGLAMEAAGGPDSGFAQIAAQIKPAVDGNDAGTLGDITLNEFGDIESGDYLVWGIEPTGWERIGTYTTAGTFVPYYGEVEIGALVPLTKNDGPHRAGEHRAFAVNTAISDFNEYLAGSGATWRLSVDIRDSQGLPSTTLRQAMDMHGGGDDDGINFIVGPSFSSGVGAVITDYINPGNVTDLALVSPSSTSPKWALVDNVYRLAIADDKGGSVIAGLLAQEGKKAIIPVWVNDPFGTGLADATVKRFLELGGVADYSTDPASGQTVRSYDRCSDTYTTCIEDQFPGMVDELAGAVTEQIRAYGSDRVAVVFVGFELPDFIAEAVRGHPVLRTVQWVGSDADVLDPLLVVEGSAVRQFMTDVDFRTYVFAGSVDSARYLALTDRLERQFPGDTFSTYTYSSYDTVWAVGLAMEAAGGPDSGFAQIAAQIKPAVDGNDAGTLGDITLNEFGDIESGDYLVWGIEPTGWERIGTYTTGDVFVTSYDDPVAVERIGGLVSLGPTGVSYLDDEYAVIMALAELDFNANSQSGTRIDVRTVDTSLGALPALHTLHYGTYDSFYYPQLVRTTDAAVARYAADGGSFDAVTGSVDSGLYPFGFDLSGRLAFHGSNPGLVGQLVQDLVEISDREVAEFGILAGPGDAPPEMWWQYFFTNPDTGTVDVKRSLLTYHEPSGLVVGTGYYPIVGGDGAHRPALEAVILEAERTVAAGGNDVTSLAGTYDGMSSPFYPFVLDTSGNLLAGSLQAAVSVAPTNVAQLRDVDMTIQEIGAALQADGDTVWLGYTFYNPATGLEEPKRSLLKQVTLGDGAEYIFASGYYPADPIRLFAGPTTSQNLSAILPYINANGSSSGSVAVSPSSSANSLAADDNAFRLTPTNSAQVPPLIGLMKADGISHVVVVPRDDAWAADLTAYLVGDGSFERYNVTAPIPISDTASVDYADVAAQLEAQVSHAIGASGGDAGSVGVVYAVFDRELIPLFGAVDSLDRASSPVFAVGHYGTAGVIDVSTITDDTTAGRVASELGMIGPVYSVPPNPASNSLVGALAALGIEENPYHRAMYDSVSILGAAAAALPQDAQYSVRDVLADGGNVPDPARIFPYAGALDDDPGITLDRAGDLVAAPSDYRVFRVVPSDGGSGYAWQGIVPGEVSGAVYADVNNNGARDAGEPGIPGVTVTLVDGAGTAASTVTGPGGEYSFAGASAGPVLVQAAPLPQLHKPSAGTSSYTYGALTLEGGLRADFALFPVTPSATATVTGKAYADTNGNTVFDGRDTGLAGVSVFVVDFLTLTQATTVTDAGGDYAVTGVLPDSVLVQMAPVPAGFLPAAGHDAYRYITLPEGATASVDFVLSPVAPQDMASVSGTVYQDNNGNGARDAGEPGIPDSLVFVFELLTAQQQTAFTDAYGQYSFAGVLPDTVLVQHVPKHESVVPTSPAGGFAYLDLGAGQRAGLDFANSGILPSPVDTLQAAAFSDTRIDLVWEEPAMSPASDGDADDRVMGYRIEAESPPGSGFEPVTPDTGTGLTWFYHTGLEPGTQYSYRVLPITGAGTGSASNVATAVTDPAR